MIAAFDAEVTALRAVATTATGARELAHDRIVMAFKKQLEQSGPGPSDADLQSFARLALVEDALRKELGCAVTLAEEMRPVAMTQ